MTKTARAAAGLLLLAAGVVAFGAPDLTPYLSQPPVPGLDRERPHRVVFRSSWSPDRTLVTHWRAGPHSDTFRSSRLSPPADCETSPACRWERVVFVDHNAELFLHITATVVAGHRVLRCSVEVDGTVADSDVRQNECTLRTTAPPV